MWPTAACDVQPPWPWPTLLQPNPGPPQCVKTATQQQQQQQWLETWRVSSRRIARVKTRPTCLDNRWGSRCNASRVIGKFFLTLFPLLTILFTNRLSKRPKRRFIRRLGLFFIPSHPHLQPQASSHLDGLDYHRIGISTNGNDNGGARDASMSRASDMYVFFLLFSFIFY